MALKYFKINEFDSPDLPGSGRNMDSDFLEMLDVARGAAGVSFKINSGYRTQAHHESIYKRLGKKPTRSAHLTGNAADIACNSSRERYKILSALLKAGFTRFGVSDSFIHVDNANDKSQNVIWTY